MLITDGGTHFVNNLVQALVRWFRPHHHVTTAYAPWANGVIERVNREIVKLWRMLMAEVMLADEQWATLLLIKVLSDLGSLPIIVDIIISKAVIVLQYYS